MSEKGYIYALMNPSLEGVVKIGKTTKDPQSHAKELSSATGMQTPFVVAFDIYVNDCSSAEECLHALLEQKGYSYDDRDFFNAPLKEVIEAMLQVQESFGEGCKEDEKDEILPESHTEDDLLDSLDLDSLTPKEPWQDIYEHAEAYYYGFDETLQDYREALKLFKQAAKLGSPKACLMVGVMYRNGEGCRENNQKALEYFKEGVRKGNDECYAEMAALFVESKQFDNAHKCWSKYFESADFLSSAHDRGRYGYEYLQQAKYNGLPIKHKETLLQIRDEILRWAERVLECARTNQSDAISYTYTEDFILFIRHVLCPETPRDLVRGKIKWFNRDKGYGFIQQNSGEDIFLHESEVIGGPGSLWEGQQVEFEVVRAKLGPQAYNVRLL